MSGGSSCGSSATCTAHWQTLQQHCGLVAAQPIWNRCNPGTDMSRVLLALQRLGNDRLCRHKWMLDVCCIPYAQQARMPDLDLMPVQDQSVNALVDASDTFWHISNRAHQR